MEWRAQMEMAMEQINLQLRASQTENLRLKQELMNARRDASKYGTPEERSFSEGWGTQGVSSGEQSNKEDGVVSQKEKGIKAPQPPKRFVSKEDGPECQQERPKEDGAEAQQERADSFGQQGFSISEESDGQEDGPAG